MTSDLLGIQLPLPEVVIQALFLMLLEEGVASHGPLVLDLLTGQTGHCLEPGCLGKCLSDGWHPRG